MHPYQFGAFQQIPNVPTTLSRKRRFVFDSDFLSKTTFKVTLALEFPVGDFSLTSSLPITYTFGTGQGRSLQSSETVYSILSTAEEYVTRLGGGINGHDCALRAICEIAQFPEHEDGFLGEVVNLIVNGNKNGGLNSFFSRESNVYQEAYYQGSYEGNCSEYQESCSISFFDFVESNYMGHKNPHVNNLSTHYQDGDPSINSINGTY
ncbi:unnamed protein product [Lepeophtheirus salmonis]|uniref:(salmon louse) hypothetical protein n=1 Tax=Lepeophtheirus salmonis TaxID=72036 RepID=A0A7R8CJH8_LEPSM|nr:unnamed protein product [Lepeophtheirus salmonis]CAF2842139.1 unnamed protein product [Lepeophtheirus salmonis]